MIENTILKEALTAANLAPSSHNCQPWMTLILTTEQSQTSIKNALSIPLTPAIVLGLDRRRCLTTLPAHTTEMHLSVGAYIQAFLEALDPTFQAEIAWTSDDGQSNSLHELTPEHFTPLMALSFKKTTPQPRTLSLKNQLASRRTHRLEYQDIAPSPSQLKTLHNAQSSLDPDKKFNFNQTLLLDKNDIDRFCRCIKQHAHNEFTHAPAWKETYRYFRWNDQHSAQCQDGFTLSHVLGPMNAFMTSLYRCILSPTVMAGLSRLRIPKLLAADMSKKFNDSHALFSLAFSSDTPSVQEEIIAGSYLMDFWLRAEHQNLSLWPCSILLQHDSARTALQSSLNLNGKCFFVGKIGVASHTLPPAPRHKDPLNNVIEI